MNFTDQLKQFAKVTDERVNLVIKQIVFNVSTGLVMKTPVGDPDYWQSPPPPGYVGGRARGNWQYGLDAPVTTSNMDIDKDGSTTISTIVGKMPEKATGHIHYLTNSVPYIKRLEEGWSKRAPNGMIGITFIEFEPIVRAAVSELRG